MKLKNLYDLASFDRMKAASQSRSFQDSDAGILLARSLEHIDPQIFTKLYPGLTFVNSGITADNSGGYANRVTSRRRMTNGAFKIAGDATTTKGKITQQGEKSSIEVVELEAQSKWSDTEIEAASLEGVNLVSDFIAGHNEVYLREIDYKGYLGVEDNEGTTLQAGLLNYAWGSGAAAGAYTTLTSQQLYDEIGDLIQTQWNSVNNTPGYKANRVDMPTYLLNHLAVKMLNTANGSSSVLRALKDNFPEVEFRSTFRANNAGGAGVSHTVAYSNSDQVMKMRIPLPLKVGEIIKVGSFDFQVDSKYRVAGLDVLESSGGYILTGL